MREHPDDENKRVSHETIYRSLFIQTRGVLKKELQAHLRATRSIRRSRHATMKHSGLGQIKIRFLSGIDQLTLKIVRYQVTGKAI